MYLICAPSDKADVLIKSLLDYSIQAKVLPLMNLEPKLDNLSYLRDNVNRFDYIVISSPFAIEISREILSRSTAIIMTVGELSAKNLSDLVKNKIIFPEISSGVEALYAEKISKLNFTNKRVLVICGESSSQFLTNRFKEMAVNFETIEIYKQIIMPLSHGYLKKIIMSSECQGIIITSNLFLKLLFEAAVEDGCLEELKQKPFITIHPQIVKNLRKHGVSDILLTPKVDRNSIVEVVRNLND